MVIHFSRTTPGWSQPGPSSRGRTASVVTAWAVDVSRPTGTKVTRMSSAAISQVAWRLVRRCNGVPFLSHWFRHGVPPAIAGPTPLDREHTAGVYGHRPQ